MGGSRKVKKEGWKGRNEEKKKEMKERTDEGTINEREVRRKEGKRKGAKQKGGERMGRGKGIKGGRKQGGKTGRKTEARPHPGVVLTQFSFSDCAKEPKGNFHTRVQRVPFEDTRAWITSCCPQSVLARPPARRQANDLT